MRYGGVLVALFAAAAIAAILFFQETVAGAMNLAADYIFGRFQDSNFPLVLAASILGAAGAMLVLYGLLVVTPQAHHLRRLRRTIEQHRTEEAFAAHFESVSGRLANSRLVGHAWREFRETLVMPSETVSVVQNTARPQTFINIRCFQEQSTALRLMAHIPNYFVGIGLLLTFIGLVAALFFATTAVGGTIDEAIGGLKHLLAAATFKFWTSIAGLLASIILSFCFRLYNLRLEGCFDSLCRALEQRMQFSTPQRVFLEVRDAVQEQLNETKKINTEMAMSIADGVGEQFKQHVPAMLADSLQPLVDAVREKSDRLGDDATSNMQDMVRQFAETIEGSAGKHLQEVSATLQQLGTSLAEMQGTVGSSGAAFAEQLTQAAQAIRESSEESARSSRNFADEIRKSLGESTGGVQTSLDRLGEVLRRLDAELQKQGEELAKVSDRSRETAGAMSDAAKEIRGGLMPFQEVGRLMSESTRSLETSLGEVAGRIEAALDSARALSERLEGVSEGLSGVWGSYQERFEKVDEDLERAFETLHQAVELQQEQVQDFVQKLDASFDRALQGLSSGIDSIEASVEELSEQLSKGA